MQFSAHTLLPYASGALGAWDSPEGICLRRLTPQQLQQFDADPHRAIRTRCNAGIALEMDTDAAALEMDYRLQKEAPRPYGYVEVFVDGAPFAAEGSDTQMALEGSLRLALPSGPKRLQIVLPALHEMAISHLALQGETRVAPVAHRFRYLAFGDSISQGYDAIFSSQAYPTRIARAIDALLVNQAIGGDVFRANYPQALPGFAPDLITVAYGTNDWSSRTREDFEEAMAGFFQNLHSAYPEIFGSELLYNALNFILGCHPGSNTASFASGVGTKSACVAYGLNRADWSYIPGGVVSGTALIRPDFPELLEFPFLWQQTEYVLGGGSSHYMFLVLAARKLLG